MRLGKNYRDKQSVTYQSVVSRKTAGFERIYMNVSPMSPGVHSTPYIHKDIETIDFLARDECTLFKGDKLENQISVK